MQSTQTPLTADASTASTTTTSTVQETIPTDALVHDVQRVLEDNREIASMAYKKEPYYTTRVKSALKKRFGWDVTKDHVRAAVNELGGDFVKRCARPHPSDR